MRVSLVLKKLSTYGFSGALTGGVAMEIHLATQRRATERRSLNDLDFVNVVAIHFNVDPKLDILFGAA